MSSTGSGLTLDAAGRVSSCRCCQPTLSHYLVLGAILFAISVIGIFLNRRNVIIMLMAIELMLLAVNLNFIAFSHYLNDTAGQIFVFFILTVAAAESAIGLAILVLLFRNVRLDRRRGPGTVGLSSSKRSIRAGRCHDACSSSICWSPLAPLVGAIVVGLWGRRLGRAASHWICILGVAVSYRRLGDRSCAT